MSYLKGGKSAVSPAPRAHASPTCSLLPGHPSPSQVSGPTWRLGSGRHGEGEGGEGGDGERAHVGWGPRVPPACARACTAQVRGRKAVAFLTSAVPEQKAEPSPPRARPDFSSRWVLARPGPGTTVACLGWVGSRGRRGTPLSPGSWTHKPFPHHPIRVASRGRGGASLIVRLTITLVGGCGCSRVTDGETEAPRGYLT